MTMYNLNPGGVGGSYQTPDKGGPPNAGNLNDPSQYAPTGMSSSEFEAWVQRYVAPQLAAAPNANEVNKLFGVYRANGTVSAPEAAGGIAAWQRGQRDQPGDQPWRYTNYAGQQVTKQGGGQGGGGGGGNNQPASTSPDAASQQNQNPANAGLFQGPNSASTNQTSLFGGQFDTSVQLRGGGIFGAEVTAHRMDERRAVGIPPQGTTTKSAEDWLRSMYAMQPRQLAALQSTLFQDGWYTDVTKAGTAAAGQISGLDQISLGQVDQGTIDAMMRALQETARYNAAGKDYSIDQVVAMKAPGAKAKGAGARARAPMGLTNPADYEAAAANQASQLMGGGLSTQEQQAVGQYGTQLEQQAVSSYDQAVAGGSTAADRGTFTQAPSPEVAARQYLLAHNAADIRSYQTAVNAIHFGDLLKAL